MRRKTRRRGKSGVGVISFLVLCICGIIAFKSIELRKKKIYKEEEIKTLTEAISKQEEREKEISYYSAYTETKKYIEDMARKKLGLVYKDEILFKSEE